METKEAVFSLRVITGNSVNDIQSADKALKTFNKELKDTQKSASTTSGIDNLKSKLDELTLKVATGGMTMKEMTKTMKEFLNIAAQSGMESPIGKQAIQAAAQLKDEIGDLKGVTTAMSSDFKKLDTAMAGLETGAAVFQGLQSAAALAGVENEELTKTMVKLQATQGIVNAVNTVAKNLNKDAIVGIQLRTALEKTRNLVMTGTTTATAAATAGEVARGTATAGATVATQGSTMAMKLLRGALIATGIGALVVGLGLLIANFDKVKEAVVNAYDRFNKLGTGVKILIAAFFPFIGIMVGIGKALEYFGVTDDATTRKAKANAEARTKAGEKELNKQINSAKHRQKSNDDYYDHEINLLSASGKATYEMSLLKAKSHLAEGRVLLVAQTAKIKLYQQEIEALIATGDADSERTKTLKKSLIDVKKIAAETYTDNLATKNAIEVMEAGHQKELADKSREAGQNAKKNQDEINKSRLEILKSRIDRENVAIEESEKVKFATMSEGSIKEIAILQDTYGDWRTEIIRKANEKQIKQLDANFEKGKMTEQEYRDELKKIMANGVKNLTTEEVQLMTEKEAQLAEGIRRAKLTAQQREIEDVTLLFKDRIALAESQGEQGKEQVLKLKADELIAKNAVIKKYADIELEEQAKIEAKRRERTKFINQLTKTEAEIALQDLNFQQIDAKKELLKRLNSDNLDEKITQQEFDAAMITLEQKKIDKIAEINKKARETQKAQEQKDREESLQGITAGLETAKKVLDNAKIVNDLMNEIGTARINKINEERDQELSGLDSKLQNELNAEGLTAEQKTAIEEKFAKQKFAVQLDAFNKEDKINRSKFDRDKALKIGQIGIDTASAIVKGIAQFGPPPSPAGILAIAAAGTIGITQALAVANQKYQGGTAPTMPSISSGGGGGSLTGESASSFTAQQTTQTSTAGLTEDAQTASQPVQVFVLENDISSTQNKVAVQESKSSF
jgi:hypothetical protein